LGKGENRMVDFEKLESAINDLDVSSKNVLKLQSIVNDISNLVAESDKVQESLNNLTGAINDANVKNIITNDLCHKTFKEFEDYCVQSKEMNLNSMMKLDAAFEEIKRETSSGYKTIETQIISKFDSIKTEVEDYVSKSNEVNAKFISQVNTLLLEMRNENTALYKTFESVIVSKFDLFKSDVVVENRKITENIIGKISNDIQRSNENINKKIKENADETTLKIEKRLDKKTEIIIALASGALVISLISLILQIVR